MLIFFVFVVLFFAFLYFFCDANLQVLKAELFGSPLNSLKGKIIWITGASGGIGESLAYCLAQHGCKLILSARREKELTRVKKQCLVSGPLQECDILIAPFDVSDINSHMTILKNVLEHFKKVDVLINNAGISVIGKSLSMPLSVDEKMVNTNVLGPIALTKAVLPSMLEKNSGHIVVISSLAGLLASGISSTYNATKFALHGYFDSLRIELMNQGISVTLICPGPVDTDIFHTDLNMFGNKIRIEGKLFEEAFKLMAISPSRCAEIIVVAIANKLKEVWICKKRLIVYTYIILGLPDVFKRIAHFIATNIYSQDDKKTN